MKLAVTVPAGSIPAGVGPAGRFRVCAMCGELCQLIDGLPVPHDIDGVECIGSRRVPRLTVDDRKESGRRRRVRVATGSSGVCPACGVARPLLRGALAFHHDDGEVCAGSGRLPTRVIRPAHASPGAVLS